MNRDQAIDAIYAGKKVGHKDWADDVYMYSDKNYNILSNYGAACFEDKNGYRVVGAPEKECCEEEDCNNPFKDLLQVLMRKKEESPEEAGEPEAEKGNLPNGTKIFLLSKRAAEMMFDPDLTQADLDFLWGVTRSYLQYRESLIEEEDED